MKITLNKEELLLIDSLLGRIVQAGASKDIKPNSTDAAVLLINKEILEKCDYIYYCDKSQGTYELELNRRQTKVLIASLLFSSNACAKIMCAYEQRPETHEAFSQEAGRRKEDYIKKLNSKTNTLNSILDKTRRAL